MDCFAPCCASHRRLNVDIRQRFSDQAGPKHPFCVVSIVTLKVSKASDAELHESVRRAVENLGGSVESLQRALFVLTPTKQFAVDDPDLVILSNWQSLDVFAKFKSSFDCHKHVAQGYEYKDMTLLISQAMLMKRTCGSLKGMDLDISKPRDDAKLEEGSEEAKRAETLKKYSGLIDEACEKLEINIEEQKAAIMWNWVKKPAVGSPGEADQKEYQNAMMTLISTHNGGPLYAAPSLVQHEAFDGDFDEVGGMVWPSLKFMKDTFDSQFFFDTYQKKCPADTLCVAAVPLRQE